MRTRRCRFQLTRLATATLVLLLAATSTSGFAASVRSVSARTASRLVASQRGRPIFLMLYSTRCPHCHTVFPDFIEVADRHRRRLATFAFATDTVVERVEEFLGTRRLPFQGLRLESYDSRALGRAFERAGIDIPLSSGVPFIALIDDDGEVVFARSGTSGVARAAAWLDEHDDG